MAPFRPSSNSTRKKVGSKGQAVGTRDDEDRSLGNGPLTLWPAYKTPQPSPLAGVFLAFLLAISFRDM